MKIVGWHYCHRCNGILAVNSSFGNWEIDTPLILCRECNAINVSADKREWKQCAFLRQLILICIYIGYGALFASVASWILEKLHLDGYGLEWLFGLIPIGRLIYLIDKSNKRLKDPAYVQLLKEHGAFDLYPQKGASTLG